MQNAAERIHVGRCNKSVRFADDESRGVDDSSAASSESERRRDDSSQLDVSDLGEARQVVNTRISLQKRCDK